MLLHIYIHTWVIYYFGSNAELAREVEWLREALMLKVEESIRLRESLGKISEVRTEPRGAERDVQANGSTKSRVRVA